MPRRPTSPSLPSALGPPTLAAAPVLDVAAFERLRGALGDAGVLADVAGEFGRSLPAYLDDVRRAERTGDLAAVGAAAHRMRGGAGVFGLAALAAHALRLENAAHAGLAGDARALVADLDAPARAALDALMRALGEA